MAEGEPYDNIAGLGRKRPVWPLIVAALLFALGATILIVREIRAPRPLRVLVAIDLDGQWWEGSKPAAIVADRVAGYLVKLGFEPVRGGDPEAVRVLEHAKSPEEAARALHAAFVVTGSLPPGVLEHKLPKGAYYEARAEGVIRVGHIHETTADVGTIGSFGGSRERDRALGLLADSLAEQAVDVVLPALLADPSIKELLADRQSNVAPQIYPARDFVLARDKATTDARAAWQQKIDGRLAKENGPNKPQYLSPPGAHDELAAVVPGGALVATNGVRPWFGVPTRSLGWFTDLETLELRAPGAPATTLFRGYNLYGYPHASPRGAPAVLVEDLFGWAKTITIVDAPNKSRRVRLDPEHRYVDPRITADGKYVAVYDRPCQSCAASLLVLATDDGRTVIDVDREEGSFDGFTWIDATNLLFLRTTVEGTQAIYVVDAASSPAAIGKGVPVPAGQVLAMPVARAKGDLVAIERRDKNAIALFSPERGTLVEREVDGPARFPSFSPDGERLVFELTTNGQSEIAVMPIAGGAPTLLTNNPYRDRYPLFSADGASVFYETLDDDPVYPERRSLSYIAVVAAPR